MANEFHDAANEIRKFAKLYKHMVVAAEAMERIGSMDQAEKERQAALDKLNARIASAQEQAEKAEQLANETMAGITESIAQAKISADNAVSLARSDAEHIKATATEKAAEIVEKATLEADRAVFRACADVDNAAAEKADIDALREQASSDVATAREELTSINRQIEEARARVKQFVSL